MSKFLKITTALVLLAPIAHAEGFGLGREALPEEIAAWDVSVRPDGRGLPAGAGNVEDGEDIFAAKCASCHGDFAEGIDNWPKLAGGWGKLDEDNPVKTVGSYWPHLSTAWDYINRSMPFGDAQSLTPDETYAIVAYILYSNYLVEDDFELSQDNLADFEMPNADGFIVDDRLQSEAPIWSGAPCMENCKETVEITMHASVLDVTPDTGTSAAPPAEELDETTAANDAADAPQEAPSAAADPQLIAAGEKVFNKCKACHQVGDGAKNRSGPILNGVVGAPAGQVEGYRYSSALQAMADEGLIWDEAALKAFLADPRGFMKGTKMGFVGLKKEDDLAAVIAYLKSFAAE